MVADGNVNVHFQERGLDQSKPAIAVHQLTFPWQEFVRHPVHKQLQGRPGSRHTNGGKPRYLIRN
jgi:hypothetical protein